jgi:periplasmic divalent cation tolerance protein
MTALFLYVTFASAQEAETIARALLERRLVACANIFPAHTSLYRWEGKIESASETAAIFKTRADLFDRVEAAVQALHSYECPCIVALPIEKGHGPFLQWIERETSST